MFPPARIPYVLPQPPDLEGPRPAPDEEVVLRLRLATAAPPAVRVGLPNSAPEVGPNYRAPREELVVAVGQRLSRTVEFLLPQASFCWGPISLPGPYIAATLVMARSVRLRPQNTPLKRLYPVTDKHSICSSRIHVRPYRYK